MLQRCAKRITTPSIMWYLRFIVQERLTHDIILQHIPMEGDVYGILDGKSLPFVKGASRVALVYIEFNAMTVGVQGALNDVINQLFTGSPSLFRRMHIKFFQSHDAGIGRFLLVTHEAYRGSAS